MLFVRTGAANSAKIDAPQGPLVSGKMALNQFPLPDSLHSCISPVRSWSLPPDGTSEGACPVSSSAP